jgi:hypothetical protein
MLVSQSGWWWWGWCLRLVLLGLKVLHCGGEVLNQLHLSSEELLGSGIHYGIEWGRWHRVLLVGYMCPNNWWDILSSS